MIDCTGKKINMRLKVNKQQTHLDKLVIQVTKKYTYPANTYENKCTQIRIDELFETTCEAADYIAKQRG